MTHNNQLSKKHSTNCFLNSLFREWTDYYHDHETSTFVIKLKDEGHLNIPVEYFSLVGRHSYANQFYFKENNNSEIREIEFLELVDILLNHLSLIYKSNPEIKNIFLGRINDSVKNITTALDLRSEDIAKLYVNESRDFIDA